MLYDTHRRTSDNTIAKTNEVKQCYTKHIEERQTIPWPKPTWTNNVIQNTSKNVRKYHDQSHQGQAMLYKTHRRMSDNTMAKTNKDKQCNTKHIEERQKIPWPKPTRTDNVYTIHIEERQTIQQPKPTRTNNVIQNTSKNVQTIPWPKPTRTNNVIQNTSKNVRQYHGQNQQGKTMLYKRDRRTLDNTIAKTNKDKQCYSKHIEERQTIPWPKPTRTNNVIQNTSKKVRQYHGQNQQGQTMLYKTHGKTSDNTMAKTNKDKQCYTKHIEERQKIPWARRTGTNNVLQNTSKNVRQYHGQNQQGQTM